MISLVDLGVFTLFAITLILIPGADTALVIRSAMQRGPNAGMTTGTGICLGLLFWGSAASLGLAALMVKEGIDDVLKWVGAAYLIYLGVTTWRNRHHLGEIKAGSRSLFLTGFLANLLNPKVAIFYLSILPQFIVPGPNVVLQGFILTAIHFSLSLLFFAILMVGLDRLSKVLLAEPWRSRIALTSGAVLIAFGIGLALH